MVHKDGRHITHVPERYRMNRNIESVKGFYEEWYVGVGDVPHIDFLECEYGSNWRKAEKDQV